MINHPNRSKKSEPLAAPAAHTAGPWEFKLFSQSAEDIEFMKSRGMEPTRILGNSGETFVMGRDEDGDPVRVAAIDAQTQFKRGEAWKGQCPRRDANAHLIAAAPDLLAAAEKMLHEVAPDRDLPATKALAAAVAKAYGKTS